MTQVILGQFLNGIIVGTLYGIIALGVTLTFGITGIVNFALGQFMMIGAYAAWHLTDITHLPYPVSVVLAVLISGLAGFLSDRALFQFTRNNLVNGLLVSIGLISIIESGALLLYTATPKNMDFVLPGSWTSAQSRSRMKVVTFGVLLAVIAPLGCHSPSRGWDALPAPMRRTPKPPCSWVSEPRSCRSELASIRVRSQAWAVPCTPVYTRSSPPWVPCSF
jgi:branched-subunit amino acid ABC-type transport system permease component